MKEGRDDKQETKTRKSCFMSYVKNQQQRTLKVIIIVLKWD